MKNARRVQRTNRLKHRHAKSAASSRRPVSKSPRRKTARPSKSRRHRKPFAGVWGSGTEKVYVKMKRTDLIGRIKDLRSKLGVDV